MSKQTKLISRALLSMSISLSLAGVASAQDAESTSRQDTTPSQTNDTGDESAQAASLSTVIVTGTRVGDRTETSSLTPVDVIPSEVLEQTGTSDLAKALDRTIPSLNFPFAPASDTFAFQRPFELRGLSPDQVLVLVNGHRWHSGALLLSLGQVAQGSQGVDLNTIPMSAIDHVEVLRDGASAQYGSDALAGVVNIILKSGAEGGGVQVTGGEYSAGDGRQWRGSANLGVPLGGDKGWLRMTAEMSNQDPANRAGVDRRPGFTHLGVKYHYGVVSFRSKNVLMNMEYDLAPNIHLYAFGHWGQRVGEPRGFYRYGTNTPEPKSPQMQYLFPDGRGFLPKEHGVSIDNSLAVGVRGETDNGWRWDVSANHGANRVSYNTWNTVNFAYWEDFGHTPNKMHDGILIASQSTLDVDLSKSLGDNWTLSFGAQYLRQAYQVKAGDEASWYVGTSGATGGAQGFAGWSPQDEIDVSRHDVAEYVQLEGNITDRLSTSIAARHEDYSDFGTTTSGAVSGRFDFTDTFALRGTVSTGFRAPGLGQQHYSETTSAHYGPGNSLGLPEGIYLRGLVPVDNPLAQLLGSEPLKPEKSRSYTVGMVWKPSPAFTTTVDLFRILVRDRIALSSSIALSKPSVLDYLADNGITNPQYTGLSYFTNAGDVRVDGVGWVSSYNKGFDNGGSLRSTLSLSYHKSKVTDVRPNPPELNALGDIGFNRLTRSDIKGLLADEMPRSKVIWTNTYTRGHWGFTGTATRYGGYTSYGSTDYTDDIVYPYRWLFDVAMHYYQDRWTFTLGSDNVLNTYPRRQPEDSDQHGAFPYSSSSPFGFQGAFVYGKVSYRW